MFILPGSRELGITHLELAGIALLVSALGVFLARPRRRTAAIGGAG